MNNSVRNAIRIEIARQSPNQFRRLSGALFEGKYSVSNNRYAWPEVDQAELQRGRAERLATVFSTHSLDHMVLQEPDSIRYATNFRAQLTVDSDWHAAVVSQSGEAHVFVEYVDERIDDPDTALPGVASMQPIPSWGPASANPETWIRQIGKQLRAMSARRVGIDAIDHGLVLGLQQALPGIEFISISTDLFQVRRVKTPLEIDLLEAASRVNSLAMDAAMAAVAVGTTDDEILARAAQTQLALGAEYVTHSVCNVRGGSGAWFAKGAALEEGDAYFFDIGCQGVGGYGSDAARTAFVGEPPAHVLAAYGKLLEAYELAKEMAVPGVKVSALHLAVNDFLTKNALGRTPYALGHGIGLRLCELPTIGSTLLMDIDDTLETGMCIALEPETSVELNGKLVVLKVEDNFAVEERGLRSLTTPYPVDVLVR